MALTSKGSNKVISITQAPIDELIQFVYSVMLSLTKKSWVKN